MKRTWKLAALLRNYTLSIHLHRGNVSNSNSKILNRFSDLYLLRMSKWKILWEILESYNVESKYWFNFYECKLESANNSCLKMRDVDKNWQYIWSNCWKHAWYVWNVPESLHDELDPLVQEQGNKESFQVTLIMSRLMELIVNLRVNYSENIFCISLKGYGHSQKNSNFRGKLSSVQKIFLVFTNYEYFDISQKTNLELTTVFKLKIWPWKSIKIGNCIFQSLKKKISFIELSQVGRYYIKLSLESKKKRAMYYLIFSMYKKMSFIENKTSILKKC